uniref:Putative ribosomal protein S21 variant 2 n=1 Tax=Taeniopygia guttata TaxID=59729 RepID=B5FYM3_TAEGU|nr:putative ribosomal protein S21 variant 2 [Taeniopygia guttata]
MDFTHRKLEKVAGEQDLMLSLCLETEDLYLESVPVLSLLFQDVNTGLDNML